VLLNEKIVDDFHEAAKNTKEYPMSCGSMLVLKNELMDLCGVTELEAINILCRRNFKDYINKYSRLAEGREIEVKVYEGEVQVTYSITEDEKDIFL